MNKSLISDTKEWKALCEHVDIVKEHHLRDLLKDEKRNELFTAKHNGIYLDFTRQQLLQETLNLLFELAEKANLRQKITNMISGDLINKTENRSVMHIALRAPKNLIYMVNNENVVPKVHDVLNHIKQYVEKVHNGSLKGATGKEFKNIISVGIGGSYLGPEFVYEALRFHKKNDNNNRTLRFLANVDPTDVKKAIQDLNPEETLVIIVSKTFTTAETMLNARTLKKWLIDNLIHRNNDNLITKDDIIKKHMIAVSTAIDKVENFGIDNNNIFGFWDWVGGRYSVTSSVGMVPLSLYFGYNIMEEFLNGAYDMDEHFIHTPQRVNIPILMGLINTWNSNFLHYNTKAILPYSQALLRFPAHIQQLDMESNGKRVTIDGDIVHYTTGEVVFGEPGTNGQHSFYQLIHQGRVVPCEFIGFCQSLDNIHLKDEGISNHDELMSNFFAQPDALAIGKDKNELIKENVTESLRSHKLFSGNRPSMSLLFDKLDPFSCGQLLSLYEHKTIVQGFIWDINSFDQWGVELGKSLATNIRNYLKDYKNKNKNKDKNEIIIEKNNTFNGSTNKMLYRYLTTTNESK